MSRAASLDAKTREITDEKGEFFLPFLNGASLWGGKQRWYLLSSVDLKECEMR